VQKEEVGGHMTYWLDHLPDGATATPATPKGVVAGGRGDSPVGGSHLAVVAEVGDTQVNPLVPAKPEVADGLFATATDTADHVTSAMIQCVDCPKLIPVYQATKRNGRCITCHYKHEAQTPPPATQQRAKGSPGTTPPT
jgi:hypothetical protein